MKIWIIILVCLLSVNCFAAIGATCVWELSTTGDQNNGGGFVAGGGGTDYSLADAAADTGTDLACADGDLASPEITSATHNFVAADVGNIIHIFETGTGFTVGWYEIVSCAANAATLDRACGTDGAKTGGDWNLGGAFDLNGTLASEWALNIVAGQTIYVKYDATAQTITETVTWAGNDGTALAPVNVIGYSGTRVNGTAEPAVYGTGRPTISSVYALTFGDFYIAKNIYFYSPAGANAISLLTLGANDVLQNCKVENLTTSANRSAVVGAAGDIFLDCEVTCPSSSLTTYGISGSTSTAIIGCYIHDCAVTGVTLGGANSMMANSVIDNCPTGVQLASIDYIRLINNTFYDCITTAIAATDSMYNVFVNNIFAKCVKGGDWNDADELINMWEYNITNLGTYLAADNVTKSQGGTNIDVPFIEVTDVLTDPDDKDFSLLTGVMTARKTGMGVGTNTGLVGPASAHWNIGADQTDDLPTAANTLDTDTVDGVAGTATAGTSAANRGLERTQ